MLQPWNVSIIQILRIVCQHSNLLRTKPWCYHPKYVHIQIGTHQSNRLSYRCQTKLYTILIQATASNQRHSSIPASSSGLSKSKPIIPIRPAKLSASYTSLFSRISNNSTNNHLQIQHTQKQQLRLERVFWIKNTHKIGENNKQQNSLKSNVYIYSILNSSIDSKTNRRSLSLHFE